MTARHRWAALPLAICVAVLLCPLVLIAYAWADNIGGSIQMAQTTAASTIKRARYVDLYGRTLPGMPVSVGSVDECEARCEGEAGCAAFTFNSAQSACFLKASAELAVSHPAAVSGYRARLEKRIRRIDMTIQEATDYPGNDIDRRKATTFEACVITCSKARTCKAFTYVIRRHECWLKNARGSAEPREGFVSGIR